MKAFNLKIAILIGLFVIANQLQAKTSLQIIYKLEYLKAFTLKLNKLQQKIHTIQIKDANGICLIQEVTNSKDSFGRMYNLEELPEGDYELMVENDQVLFVQPIRITHRFLTIKLAEQKEILKPSILVKEDYLTINMLHFEKEAISFTVKNEAKEIIYTHSFKTYGSLNKQLNVSKLPKGNYSLDIRTKNYGVSKTFSRRSTNTLLVHKF